MRKLVVACLMCLLSWTVLSAAEWQWSVEMKGCVSKETGRPQEAFLWIPPTCERVKAVMVGQQNMSEETLFHLPAFREAMERLGVALIWIAPELVRRIGVGSDCTDGAFGTSHFPLELCSVESGAYVGCHFPAWRCAAHQPDGIRAC